MAGNGVFGADNIGGGGAGPGGGTGAHGKVPYRVYRSNGGAAGVALGFGIAGATVNKTGLLIACNSDGSPRWCDQNVRLCGPNGVESSRAFIGNIFGMSVGDRVSMDVDTINKLIWYKNITTNSVYSFGVAGTDPATGIGGVSFSGIDTSGGIFPYFCGTGFSGTDDTEIVGPGQTIGVMPTGQCRRLATGLFNLE
jgi:hypothetical protein